MLISGCVTNCVTTGTNLAGFGRTSVDAIMALSSGNVLVAELPGLLHTEEVTGSIPVSPTAKGLVRGSLRSFRPGLFDVRTVPSSMAGYNCLSRPVQPT